MQVSTWTFSNVFNNLFFQVISFLPNLVAALILFLVGLVVANSLGELIKIIIKKARVDFLFEKVGVRHLFQEAGISFNAANFTGWLVKWFIIVAFLIAVANALGLPQVSIFINQVALYLPNVLVAVAILVIGMVIANALSDLVYKTASATHLVSAGIVRVVVKWSILIFVLLAVLTQLNIATRMVETLFMGIVIALSGALGLAFGLGGKEKAKEIIDRVSEELSKRS